jgi:hypothetical protein
LPGAPQCDVGLLLVTDARHALLSVVVARQDLYPPAERVRVEIMGLVMIRTG